MKHLMIPDAQVKPGDSYDHLEWLGHYIVEKKPDTVINIGDFADMPSLSSYDIGHRSFEGRRYRNDIAASHEAMERLLKPGWDYNAKAAKNHDKRYTPRMVMCLGNHEHRIEKATDLDAKLEGVLSIDDLKYADYGWEAIPFLQPVVVDGVAYCHYFPSGVLGRPCTSARAMLNKMHMSCVAGHQQGRDIAYGKRADGRQITALIAGSFYQHNEDYLSPLANNHWRGFYVFHEVEDGGFDEMAVSLNYLRRKYGG